MAINHTGGIFFGTESKPYKEKIITDPIVDTVIDKFKGRSDVGIAKYGTTVDRNDLSVLDWLKHLQEELMDATLYIEKLSKELNKSGWYDESLDKRANIVGQNGNDGEHYDV